MRIVRTLALSAAILGTACVVADISGQDAGSNEVAVRYHLRSRTQRFFDRVVPTRQPQRRPKRNAPNTRQHAPKIAPAKTLFPLGSFFEGTRLA